MRKIVITDYAWLIAAAQQVSKNIILLNLSECSCSDTEINIHILLGNMKHRLRQVIGRKIRRNESADSWEVGFVAHESDGISYSANISWHENTAEALTSALLEPIKEYLNIHNDICAIQIWFRKKGESEWENYLFYVT